jgi:trimeric autotransporter adhesin
MEDISRVQGIQKISQVTLVFLVMPIGIALKWRDTEMKRTQIIVAIMLVLFSSGGIVQATEIQTYLLTSFGYSAGVGGERNAFYGDLAGNSNGVTGGGLNSFFGSGAGATNTTGSQNSFFGSDAGVANTTGGQNSFFGGRAGYSNTTGSYNTFFGVGAGYSNSTAFYNIYFGQAAGYYNTTGTNNAFVGRNAGLSNTVEQNNSFIGAYSDGAAGVNNATAIGYRAQVTRSDSLVLGGVNGLNGATAETNVGIGVANPDRQLTVEGTQAVGRLRRYYGTTDPFTRTFAPTFLLERARGTQAAPSDIWAGDYLGKVQFRGVVGSTAIEYGAMAFIATDTSQNGRFSFLDRDISTERMVILNTGNVGINTTAPLERLHVVGNVRIDGDLIWTDSGASVPDYVFDPGYKLMGIDELKKFIAKERHLPNIPAASDVKDKGLNMSEFQMKMLEKIEELTLYTVQQAKAIEDQKAVLEQKDSKIAALDARLAELEQMMGRLAKQEK